MTHPTPPEAAKPVDLEELGRQLATDPYAEDATCPRCHSPFGCDDELEPSIFCHNCAHEVAESVTPLLVAELRTLREAHERTRKALIDYHECEGFEHTTFIDEDGDEVSCPEDDTCDCPWFDAINEAMKPLPALPDAPKAEL